MTSYSKISLCALFATGTALGMELPLLRQGLAGQEPRLNAPVQNQAAQALNQPMIKVFSDRGQIDTIQSNYLETSATLKNMLEDVDADQALVLPESMIEDYVAIKDLLVQEYRLNAEITDEKTVINILKSKTEQQLVAIANACQRFELNQVSNCAVKILAEQLNALERKEKCLKNGSYNLNWTPDVARLVAQEMIRCDATNKTMTLIYWLAQATLNKNGRITFQDLNYANGNYERHSFTNLMDFFPSEAADNFGPIAIVKAPRRSIFENMYCIPYVSLPKDTQQNIQLQLLQKYGIEYYYNYLLPRLKYSVVEKFPAHLNIPITHLGFYHRYTPEFENYVEKKLLPEELTLMEYCFKSKKEHKQYDFNYYPGIEKLRKNICHALETLLFPNWWQQRSWLSKAAIITGGAAATGLAAWYGYKYFSKK